MICTLVLNFDVSSKSINEYLHGLFSDFLQGAAKLFVKQGIERTKWIPERKLRTKVWKRIRDFLSDDPVENVVLNSAKRRTEALDETGAYNLPCLTVT